MITRTATTKTIPTNWDPDNFPDWDSFVASRPDEGSGIVRQDLVPRPGGWLRMRKRPGEVMMAPPLAWDTSEVAEVDPKYL